jgi:hypothetical protein
MSIKHISALRNCGIDDTCVIIGGGTSAADVNLDRIPEDYHVISLNDHGNEYADIIMYYDIEMRKHFDYSGRYPHQLLIGARIKNVDHVSKHCTHYYEYTDCRHGDIGFRALQFADQVFNYSKIYLVGYDYYTEPENYHFDKASTPEQIHRFNTFSVGVVLPLYEKVEWKNKIINISKKSMLKIFDKRDYFAYNK